LPDNADHVLLKGGIKDYRKRTAVELEIVRGTRGSRVKRRYGARIEVQAAPTLVEQSRGTKPRRFGELKHNEQLGDWVHRYREMREDVARKTQSREAKNHETQKASRISSSDWLRVSIPYLRASVRPITYALRGLSGITGPWSLSSLSPRSA